MAPNSKMFSVASALTGLGIMLVLVNWYTKPDAALAFTAALAMFVVMVAVLRVSRRTARHSTAEGPTVPGLDRIPTAVMFAALMMGIPLALTLARSYGLGTSSDVDRRSTGVLIGAFLAMLGNVMPKNLPPFSSGCDGARQQAFQRLAGWTWVLCGLGSAVAWLTLSIDAAQIATIVLAVAAIVLTIVQILRLGKPRKEQPASGLN
jgi:hypothetical protein